MTIQNRPNNAFALVCDQAGCTNEILGPTEDDVLDDASLVRWRIDQNGVCTCMDCLKGRTGNTVQGPMVIKAPTQLSAGDVVMQSGRQVGWALADADAGEMVELSMTPPNPVASSYGPAAGGAGQLVDEDTEDFFADADIDLENDTPEPTRPKSEAERKAEELISSMSDDEPFGGWN
jgi:hypothetical protein